MADIRIEGELVDAIINNGKAETDTIEIQVDGYKQKAIITTLMPKIEPNIRKTSYLYADYLKEE